MAKRGKRYTEAKTKISNQPASGFEEAVKRALESSFAKFDETVDVAVRLGVDPRHADQIRWFGEVWSCRTEPAKR